MTKALAALAALLALGAVAARAAGPADPSAHPPGQGWVVAQGYSGYSGYPWPGPPWSWPILPPRLGCYEFHQRLAGAWRRVEVCE